MGFFNFLETAFFISLAITFVLIMMLVYHFKGRLVILEQKCDTMFEIMNNMIKELKSIQARSIATAHAAQNAPVSGESIPALHQFSGGFPMDLLSMLGGKGGNVFSQNQFLDEEDDEEDEDNDNATEYKKIVVSDTELESDDDEEDEHVKVIHVDISEETITPDDLPDLEEVEPEESVEGEPEDASVGGESLDKQVDYKKMDISYLRTLVITRGLASDTKKLKKADLVKLLSDE
jgi:hypothetical protein